MKNRPNHSYLMYVWWYIRWWWWCQFWRFNAVWRFNAHQISASCKLMKINKKIVHTIGYIEWMNQVCFYGVEKIAKVYLCWVLSKMNSRRWPRLMLILPVLYCLYSSQLRMVYKILVMNLLLMEWIQAIVVSPRNFFFFTKFFFRNLLFVWEIFIQYDNMRCEK